MTEPDRQPAVRRASGSDPEHHPERGTSVIDERRNPTMQAPARDLGSTSLDATVQLDPVAAELFRRYDAGDAALTVMRLSEFETKYGQ